MPSLKKVGSNSRPRLREKGSSALSAQRNSPLNKLRLLPANSGKLQERRAPKLLHVGRRLRAIQGRRVGEWHRQLRSASAVPLRRPHSARWTEGAALPTRPPDAG